MEAGRRCLGIRRLRTGRNARNAWAWGWIGSVGGPCLFLKIPESPPPLDEYSALASGAVGSPKASGTCSPHAEEEAHQWSDSRSTAHTRARVRTERMRLYWIIQYMHSCVPILLYETYMKSMIVRNRGLTLEYTPHA